MRAVPIERDGKIAEWVGACTDVTSQREAEEMRGRLTDQLSAAALRTARLQQATAMLAEALDVEQVVEVITEVGRTAIGALRSAVALLDEDKLGLRVVNPVGPRARRARRRRRAAHPGHAERDDARDRDEAPGAHRRPRGAARQFASDPDVSGAGSDAILDTGDEQAWVGLPLLAAGMPLGALRFSFGKPRTILEEERVFLEALAGQCALAVERAEMYEKEHTAAVTLQRSLLPDELPSVPGLALDARYLPRSTDVGGGLVRRVPAAGPAAGRHRRRRHGQGAARGGRHGPGAQRAARARADRPAARRRCWPGLTGCSPPPSSRSRSPPSPTW